MKIKELITNIEVLSYNNGHFLPAIFVIAACFLPIPAIILDIILVSIFAFNIFILLYIIFKKTTPFIFPKLLIISTECNLFVCAGFMRMILAKGSDFKSYFIHLLIRAEIEKLVILSAIFFIYLAFHIYAISRIASRIGEINEAYYHDYPIFPIADYENKLKDELYYNDTFSKIKRKEVNKIQYKKEGDFYREICTAGNFISSHHKVIYLIIFINVFAGIFIGTYCRGETLNEALVTYISLVISSGMIVLLPSFLLGIPVEIFFRIFRFWYFVSIDKPLWYLNMYKDNKSKENK